MVQAPSGRHVTIVKGKLRPGQGINQARPRLAGVVLAVIAAGVSACSFRAKTSGGAAGSGGVAGATGSGTGGGGAGGGAGVATGAGGVTGGFGSAGSGGVAGNSASTGAFPPPIGGVTSISATGPNATPPIPTDAAKKFGGAADGSRNPARLPERSRPSPRTCSAWRFTGGLGRR